jgi:hypothetical protein
MEQVPIEAPYEPPVLTVIGSLQEVTAGQVLQHGQDDLSSIPIIGGFFGS